MGKTIRYAFLTCTLAYVLAAILLVIFFAVEGINVEYMIKDLLTALTLALSEFTWWGNLFYIAFIVPWLASSLVLVLFIHRFNGGAKRRRLLGGLSVFAYYFAMVLVFIIHGLVRGWGDVGYQFFPIWLIVGFGLGYLAATIVERIFKLQVAD